MLACNLKSALERVEAKIAVIESQLALLKSTKVRLQGETISALDWLKRPENTREGLEIVCGVTLLEEFAYNVHRRYRIF